MLKFLARKVINHLPDEGRSVIVIYRYIVSLKHRIIIKKRIFLSKRYIPHPETIYWISPERIMFYTRYCKEGAINKKAAEQIKNQIFRDQVFDRVKDNGKIYGGNWDISDYKFSDLEVYKAVKQRIENGIPWEETAFYRTTISHINSGKIMWNCTNELDFIQRCKHLDELIKSIKENGYKLSCNIVINGDEKFAPSSFKKNSKEILVNIGRNGEYLFQDGRHRLSIAKILKIDRISVKVLVRHKEWQDMRDLLESMVKDKWGASGRGQLYQNPIHPDLVDFPFSHDCQDRFEAMKRFLQNSGGILLDVGANFGFFCHKFEELNYKCYAIELSEEVAMVAEKIRIAEGKHFKIINKNLFDIINDDFFLSTNFDIILALNIFHHFLKTKENYIKLKKWFEVVKLKQMFFEPHRYDETQMLNAYINYNDNEFVDFILENTKLNNAECICEAKDGRKLYRLYQ